MDSPGAIAERAENIAARSTARAARSAARDTAPETAASATGLAERYRQVRATTEQLAEPLSPEDCTVQAVTEASPVKWHLAHTSWFFETFLLGPSLAGYREFHPDFRVLFNSYYQTVGAQHPRGERGLVTRPGLEEVRAYRRHVDRHMLALLGGDAAPGLAGVIEIGLQHEQQHQELIQTDVKALLSHNPLHPAYRRGSAAGLAEPGAPTAAVSPLAWRSWDEGLYPVGWEGPGFAFDNESPRHRVFLEAFELASRPVTNAEYLEFMADGGYARPELWLADGWNEVAARGWGAPLYWQREPDEDAWHTFTLAGRLPVRADEPVCHLSFYEADAYARWAGARWAGARLPREEEWEVAAALEPIAGRFLEDCLADGVHHPQAGPDPRGAGLAQLFGDVWEWTASPYVAYPRYRPPAGALGEYNGKFMCNQIVLRGGSSATPRSHIRATYRNFFPPEARWQFSGLRLARDV